MDKSRGVFLANLKSDHPDKHRALGNIKFVGELVKKNVVSETIPWDIVDVVIDYKIDFAYECLVVLITTCGEFLENFSKKDKVKAFVKDLFSDLPHLVAELTLKPSTKSLIQDLIDLREREWVSKDSEGP